MSRAVMTSLLVAGLLAGCGPQTPSITGGSESSPGTAGTPGTSGNSGTSGTSGTSGSPGTPGTPGTSGTPAAGGHVFSFTSLQPELEDPRILDWIEDPCGMTPVARVESMPINDPSLAPDWVVEFDADGRELRRWGKPYGAEIRGIVGERLHFRITGIGGADYWTDLDGRIGQPGPLEPAVGPLEASATTCPALPTFEGSDYELCHDVIDGVGKTRKLAWEGACS